MYSFELARERNNSLKAGLHQLGEGNCPFQGCSQWTPKRSHRKNGGPNVHPELESHAPNGRFLPKVGPNQDGSLKPKHNPNLTARPWICFQEKLGFNQEKGVQEVAMARSRWANRPTCQTRVVEEKQATHTHTQPRFCGLSGETLLGSSRGL